MRTLLLFLMMVTFAQAEITSFTAESFSAIIAKSAKIEQRTDTVAVFLTGDLAPESGAFLTITSNYKFVSPYVDAVGVTIEPSKTTKSLFNMYAPIGKYKVLLVESDPEKGILFSNREIEITAIGTKPPIVVPPPGDYNSIIKVSKDNADRLNDPKTRASLKAAYTSVVPILEGKTYEDARNLVITARFAVFNARQGSSRLVDWDSWRIAVDNELVKQVKPGDTVKYLQALKAIISSL